MSRSQKSGRRRNCWTKDRLIMRDGAGTKVIGEMELCERLGLARKTFVKLRESGQVRVKVHWGRIGPKIVWTEDGIKAAEVLLNIRAPLSLGGSGLEPKRDLETRKREGYREKDEDSLDVVANRASCPSLVEALEVGKEEVMGVLRANFLNKKVVRCLRGNGEQVMVRVRDAGVWGTGKALNGGMKGIVAKWDAGCWREVMETPREVSPETVRRWRKGLDGLKVGAGGALVRHPGRL